MDTCFIDYDDSLIGRIPFVDAYNFYGPEAGGANERKAVECIRYAIEEILEWTPDDAVQKFDSYMIRIMRLDKLLTYINFPVEVPFGNTRYILSLLYPGRIRLDNEKLVEETFETVLESARKKKELKGTDAEERLKQFPREYFSGTEGFRRFCCCIKYILENYKPMSSVEEIYSFFCSPQGKRLLYDFRLKVPADQFSIDMLSVIHYITQEEPDSDLFYCFYSFQKELGAFPEGLMEPKDEASEQIPQDRPGNQAK